MCSEVSPKVIGLLITIANLNGVLPMNVLRDDLALRSVESSRLSAC